MMIYSAHGLRELIVCLGLSTKCRRRSEQGFELFAIFSDYVHEVTGRTLQLDGLFLHREAVEVKA